MDIQILSVNDGQGERQSWTGIEREGGVERQREG